MTDQSSCNHDCGSCSANCNSRQQPESFQVPVNEQSSVKKVIGVVSGKGGVGKSLVTALLATATQKAGFKTGVLDADITGPSIPKLFGLHGNAQSTEFGILPKESQTGVEIMSINLLLEQEDAPVIWRGPIIGNAVKQFWTDVVWGDLDNLFVDMPPGTGDVALSVFQSLPVNGIIVVTTPQDLVSLIVAKAVNMARMMDIPILGLIENMSYLQCPDCGKRIEIFGASHLEDTAAKYGLDVLGRIPIDPVIAQNCDNGRVEEIVAPWLEQALLKIENQK